MLFLIFVPQPRGPAQTATLPVTMATASRSGGNVTARRSVLMDLMSQRPPVVSLAPPQFPPQHIHDGMLLGSQDMVRGCSVPETLGSGRSLVTRQVSVEWPCLPVSLPSSQLPCRLDSVPSAPVRMVLRSSPVSPQAPALLLEDLNCNFSSANSSWCLLIIYCGPHLAKLFVFLLSSEQPLEAGTTTF